MAADVRIDIAAEFTGKKAFKQAETSTEKLTKNVKKLAGAFGLAFGTARILAYGKASVKAAAADQKAQQQLALALKNVGLERDAATSEALIQRLQSEYGIVDDLLRPAYQALAIATRDTVESQRLLNLSLDISAATGKDLGSVTTALSRAYLGNNTALSRLGVGISKADLKVKSFYEITTDLQDTFKGSATAAANTFQGSMDKLGVASANVSEIIGTSLIDALKGLGDEKSVDNLAASMEKAAERTGDVIRGIGVLIGKLKQIPGLPDFGVLFDISYLRLLEKIGSASRAGSAGGFPQGAPADLTRQFPIAQTKPDKIAKDTLKINKESLKLAKARAVFDLQKIQIEAALKGKISEEDKIRLKLMQAIEEENLTNVEKYQKALEKAQEKTKELTELLATVKTLELKDPFGLWKIDPLTASINDLTKSMFAVQTQIQANGREWSSFSSTVAGTSIKPNLGEWNSSFSAAGKSAADAIAAQSKAQQDAVAAQIKSAQDAAAAQLALLTAGSAEQKAALEAQLKAQSEALAAQAKAQMEALQTRLADEAAAYKEAAEAAAAAAQAALLTGATDYTAASLAKIASDAAAQAAAAQAAQAAADQASAATSTAGSTPIAITVNTGIGDPNAIAEEIQKLLQDAANRGVLIGGLYAE
jgi:hypothetical protein